MGAEPPRTAGVGAPTRVRGYIARLVAARAVRSGTGWGLVFGVYVFASAAGFASQFRTAASRTQLARSLGGNTGLAALLGPARRIDTVAGFTAWRSLGVLAVVGAVWGTLAGTRLVRGEEDAGRWELLLAGPTTRQGAAAQALLGLAAGWLALFGTTAVITLLAAASTSGSFSAPAAVYLALAITAGAALFLAVGALTSQLAASRRQAAGIAAALLGAAFVVRLVADSGTGLGWMRWLSPLGWVEEAHPLTGPQPAALIPIAGLLAVLCLLTVRLAGARDIGASVLPGRDTGPTHTALLGGPARLALRLVRGTAYGWTFATAAMGLLLGLVAEVAASAVAGSATVAAELRRLGVTGLGAADYLGVSFLTITAMVLVVAAGQAAAIREEEAAGRLDTLLVRAVGRGVWLTGRVAVAALLVSVCAVTAAVSAWFGEASQHIGIGFPLMLEAGLNMIPPAILLLGLATATFAVAPRWTSRLAYAAVVWSFLIELVGTAVNAPRWLLDSSLLLHLNPVPATGVDWFSAAWMIVIGLAAAAAGVALFPRRDLVGA